MDQEGLYYLLTCTDEVALNRIQDPEAYINLTDLSVNSEEKTFRTYKCTLAYTDFYQAGYHLSQVPRKNTRLIIYAIDCELNGVSFEIRQLIFYYETIYWFR